MEFLGRSENDNYPWADFLNLHVMFGSTCEVHVHVHVFVHAIENTLHVHDYVIIDLHEMMICMQQTSRSEINPFGRSEMYLNCFARTVITQERNSSSISLIGAKHYCW